LRSNSFAAWTIVIHARLSVLWRINRISKQNKLKTDSSI
jgi:hypothetical protein